MYSLAQCTALGPTPRAPNPPPPARSYNPMVIASRIHELEEEAGALKLELSPQYAGLILKFSSYEKPQQVGLQGRPHGRIPGLL